MTWLLANYTTSHVHSLSLKIIFFKQNHHSIFEKTLHCMHNFNFDGFKYWGESTINYT
jgi:hypothetical protein